MFGSVVLFSVVLFGAVRGEDDGQAKLRFYFDSFENFIEYPMNDSKGIFSQGWYNSSRVTVVICHGYTGHAKGPAMTAIVNTFLKLKESNVALLNWDKLAASTHGTFVSSYFNWAAPNAMQLGMDFAETLLSLSHAGLDLSSTQLVGHSLGAHVIGIAGNKIQQSGIHLPWIIGLDPASFAYDDKPEHLRLNEKSAKFVAVIHSDPSKYGSRKQMGTVDFWPNFRNGPVLQPGCIGGSHPRFSPQDLCNHNRCWQLYIDALNHPGTLLATYARNFRIWKRYSKRDRLATVLDIGKFHKEVVPGNYYMVTASSSPYGLGENGL